MIDEAILFNKVIKFLKDYDGKEINAQVIKDNFSLDETVYFYNDDGTHDYNYRFLFSRMKKTIDKLDNFFTNDEALYGFSKTDYIGFCNFLDDNTLLKVIQDKPDYSYVISSYMSNDQVRQQAIQLVPDEEKISIIRRLSSDSLKLEYLKLVNKDDKDYVICSLKDDYLKEKYLTLFKGNKGKIIVSLSSDEKKIYYLRKYGLLLSKSEKTDIIISLTQLDNVIEQLTRFGSDDAIESYFYRVDEDKKGGFQRKIIPVVKNIKNVLFALDFSLMTNEEIERLLNNLDSKLISEVFDSLPKEFQHKAFEKCNERHRITIIKDIIDEELQFDLLNGISKTSSIIHAIEHFEKFPNYKDEYKNILEKYSTYYNVDLEHLEYICKNISLSVLKYMNNDNLRKIINLKSEEFEKIVNLLDVKNQTLNFETLNDIMNSLLQREFRLNQADEIIIFPSLLSAIDRNDIEFIKNTLNKIALFVDVNAELKKVEYENDIFFKELMTKNSKAIETLHIITTKYLKTKRNDYIKDNIQDGISKCTSFSVEKNSFAKFMFNSLSMDLILSILPTKSTIDAYKKYKFYNDIYTDEEKELICNEELYLNIIRYKCNPRAYDSIPEDVKINIKLFNSILDKVCSNSNYVAFLANPDVKKKFEIKKVDFEYFINILMNLDIDKMKNGILSNEEMFKKLEEIFNKYKFAGWGNNLDPKLSTAGVSIDAEIVSNIIQYFDLLYTELEEKLKSGQIASISLTAMLDLASCYSTESKKYSVLFGEDNFKFIASNPGPNSSSLSKAKRINIALQKLKEIRERDYVAVPPCDKDFELSSGKKINVVIGNTSNPINLTYGERTGACMRIGGAGSSLFDFCLDDDNGFHIRFSSTDGGFVSRVSGFRNGNTVFLNQLRYPCDKKFSNSDLVETCRIIAREMIEATRNSVSPIDNVVITSDYVMDIPNMKKIDLGVSDVKKGMKSFYTDINESAILLASSSADNGLVPLKLGNKGQQKFLVQRDKIVVKYSENAIQTIQHIEAMDQFLSGKSVDEIEIQTKDDIVIVYCGEDWYVSLNKEGKVEQYIMKNSNNKEKALSEVQDALLRIKNDLSSTLDIQSDTFLGK